MFLLFWSHAWKNKIYANEKLMLLHFCTPLPPLPPIVIDDSSWKNAAEIFTIALTLTLGAYESAIASKS